MAKQQKLHSFSIGGDDASKQSPGEAPGQRAKTTAVGKRGQFYSYHHRHRRNPTQSSNLHSAHAEGNSTGASSGTLGGKFGKRGFVSHNRRTTLLKKLGSYNEKTGQLKSASNSDLDYNGLIVTNKQESTNQSRMNSQDKRRELTTNSCKYDTLKEVNASECSKRQEDTQFKKVIR